MNGDDPASLGECREGPNALVLLAEKSPYRCQRIAAATSQSPRSEFIERNLVGVEGGKLVPIFGRAVRFQSCVESQERRQSLGH